MNDDSLDDLGGVEPAWGTVEFHDGTAGDQFSSNRCPPHRSPEHLQGLLDQATSRRSFLKLAAASLGLAGDRAFPAACASPMK